jgi:hypothetical protein
VTVTTFAGLPSLLAQTGSLFTATGRLQRSTQSIRWLFLAAEVFWTSHNLIVGSVWGLTSDTMGVTMLVLGLWRGRKVAGLAPWLAPLRARWRAPPPDGSAEADGAACTHALVRGFR